MSASVLEAVRATPRENASAPIHIEASGVSKQYGGAKGVLALDDVSLRLSNDDSLALLGRSGSGKTTLLHVLGGLVEPASGDVEWHGSPLSSLDSAARGAVRAKECQRQGCAGCSQARGCSQAAQTT